MRGNLVQTEVEDLLNMEESYVTAYTYDAVGNRLTQTKTTSGQTETTQYTYNSLNQMLTSTTTKADGTVTETKTYQYDANGNQIKEADSVSGTETSSIYDPAGRLANCIKKENGQITLEQTNKYNGSGARIQKKESVTEAGVSTETVNNYFCSQGGVLYTEDGSGNGTSLNLQGISGNVIATAREEAGVESYYYYHKDPTGSTTNLRSADGTTVISYQYTDFGETSIYGDTDFYNEICYNGAIYDESTGLYYLSARYYDPEDGRFLTRDSYRGTATNSMTWHLYAYCANNPINYDDPSGHLAVRTVVGGIVGGLVGFAAGVKLAKSTNKTWKKVAIIAGCTLAGGAVGAVVGTVATPKNIASAVKRVASYTKNKLPSIRTTLKKMKTTVQKVSTGARKTVSQSRQVISHGNTKIAQLEKEVVQTSGKYQVGAYQKIKWVEGLDAHHVGQKALMKKLVANYDFRTAPAINVPKIGHTISGPNGIVSRSMKGIDSARQLLARDLFELKRVYPDIPNTAFRELISMNMKMYLEMRK